MLNSALLKILGSLTPEEMRDFKEFVASPYFNKNENVIKLFNYIKKFYPEFNDAKLEKEYVYKRLFSSREYNDGFMRTLVFNLNKLADEYLTHISLAKDKVKKGIYLLKELNERKAGKPFLKHFKETENTNEASAVKHSDYFFNKYNLTVLRETHQLMNKSFNRQQDEHYTNMFRNSYENLTFFYLTSVLREYRFLIYQNNFIQSDFDSELLEHILKYLSDNSNKYLSNSFINLHLHEILLQKDRSVKDYKVLKNILKNEYHGLSCGERFSLLNILQIFCMQKGFSGDVSFRNERFELYSIILSQKLYSSIPDSYFEETLFANIVNSGLSLAKFEWVEGFISQHKDMLQKNIKDSVVNYSYAKLNFEKGSFENTLEYILRIVNVKNPLLKSTVRTLTLLTYYELGLMSQVFYQIDSYRHFLSKNKKTISDDRFQRLSNLLKYFTRLAKIREKKKKSDLNDLKHDLESNPNTVERSWLIRKANEL